MERDLRVGGVFGTALSVFRARARLLVPISLVSTLLDSAINALLGEGALGAIGGFIVNMAYFAFISAVAMVVLSDIREERPVSSARELLARALPPLPTGTLAATLAFVGVCGAVVLLVVPGLYLATIWAVLLPVVVIERPDLFDAFGRSRQLVRRNGWKVLGIVLLLGLILLGTTLPFAFLGEDEVVRRVIGALVSSFTTPYAALVIGALYYRLLDLERAGSGLQQPGDSPG
jgi:hypothetical protein